MKNFRSVSCKGAGRESMDDLAALFPGRWHCIKCRREKYRRVQCIALQDVLETCPQTRFNRNNSR